MHPNASELALAGLAELGHRGQGSRGIGVAKATGDTYIRMEREGQLPLAHPFTLMKLEGDIAVAQERYPTSGSSDQDVDSQPAYADSFQGRIVVVENGDTPTLEKFRAPFRHLHAHTEAEAIARFLAREIDGGAIMTVAIQKFQQTYDGAFSLIVLFQHRLYLACDRHKFRPLWYGRGTHENGRAWYAAASENDALLSIECEPIREVEAGEIVILGAEGAVSAGITGEIVRAHCLFELVYFLGVASDAFGIPAEEFRYRLGVRVGERLRPVFTREDKLQLDVVCSVPDSSNPFSEGLATGIGVPLSFGLMRKHRRRTFTLPGGRHRAVASKFRPSHFRLIGKRALFGEDSIVRGTTIRKLVGMIRADGRPAELHLAVSCAPILGNCFYGIDMKEPSKLIAPGFTDAGVVDTEALAKSVGLDSVTYATIEDMAAVLESFGANPDDFCTACWTEKYPTEGGRHLAEKIARRIASR